jgi:hypothetical protein
MTGQRTRQLRPIPPRVASQQACRMRAALDRLDAHSGALVMEWIRGGISRDDLRISFARDKVALFEDAVRNALPRGQAGEAFERVERVKA